MVRAPNTYIHPQYISNKFMDFNYFVLLATAARAALFDAEFYENDEPRPSFLSRRAIDGSRGRKYFDPQKDGFFDDYGYDRGQDNENTGKLDYADLKYNVPGEPGVDYPAYLKIPRTSFSCYQRSTGYYADEETGCQVFHVCDDGKVSSFLCPVGSLFSQRLLTCDWWNKVTCSTSEYYVQQHLNFNSDLTLILDPDQEPKSPEDDDKIGGDPVSESRNIPPTSHVDQQSENNRAEPVLVVQNSRRNDNYLDVEAKRSPKSQYSRTQQRKSITVSAKDEDVTDSPVIRIQPTLGTERPPKKTRGQNRYTSSSSQNDYYRKHPVYVAVQSTSTTPPTTVRTPKSTSIFKAFDLYHRTLSPTTTATYSNDEYQATTFASTLNDEYRVQSIRGNNMDQKTQTEFSIYNFANEYEDMELKESIGIANSHSQRLDENTEKNLPTTKSRVDAGSNSNSLRSDDSKYSTSSIEFTTQRINDEIQTKANTDVQNNFETTTERSDDSEEYYGDSTTQIYPSTIPGQVNDFPNAVVNDVTNAVSSQNSKNTSGPVYYSVHTSPKKVFEESQTQTSVNDVIPSNHRRSDEDLDSLTQTTVTFIRDGDSNITIVTPVPNTAYFPDTIGDSSTLTHAIQKQDKNNTTPEAEDQSPLSAEPVGQLFLRYEDQPIYLRNLESARSVPSDGMIASHGHNEHNVRISLPGPGSYQNFRIYQDRKVQQQNHAQNFEPVSMANPGNHLSTPLEPSNHKKSPHEESPRHSDYEFIPVEMPQSDNSQNHEDGSSKHYNLNDTPLENYESVSTTPTYDEYAQQEPSPNIMSPNNHDQRQEIPNSHINLQDYDQRKSKNYRGQYGAVPDQPKFLVNYQTHQRPEDLMDYRFSKQGNYHSQAIRQHHETQELQDHRNGHTLLHARPHQNHRETYPQENQNGDQAEEVGIVYAGNFGARIPTKNVQNSNKNVIIDDQKVSTQGTDAYAINFGLEGNDINVLWAMRQMAESNRQPRPFVQDDVKLRSHQTVPNYTNGAKNNHEEPLTNDPRSHGDLYSNSNQYENPTSQRSNFNSNRFQDDHQQDRYKVNTDDFAAPVSGVSDESHQIPHQQNIHSNNAHEAVYSTQSLPREENFHAEEERMEAKYGSVPLHLRNQQNPGYRQPLSNTYQNGQQEVSSVNSVRGSHFRPTPRGFNHHYNTGDNQQSHKNSWTSQQDQVGYTVPSDSQTDVPSYENTQEPEQFFVTKDHSHGSESSHAQSQSHPNDDSLNNFHQNPAINHNSQEYFEPTNEDVIASYANYQNLEVKQTPSRENDHRQNTLHTGIEVPNSDESSDNRNQIQSSQPSTDQRFVGQNSNNSSDLRYPGKIKTTVETEFIPALSFDFGSQRGQQEYLEALQKGLVSNDGQSASTEKNFNPIASPRVDSVKHRRRTSRSDANKAMDNFKDTSEVMSGTA
ncbi:hypothetical protein QAD02_019608 [Eretmocerus hayati]|uniref:Uncharacterized protein n=1 Tax=Eretmocerus hayati TaxID=131215 RepID=A0ACC2PLX4_9HYME|nr:hypothetical protein QAD02_019608 [Eretmocerus hayati]